jgi:nucleotide-binding universal stress UspA family protein
MKTILVPIDFQNASAKALSYIENVFNEQQIELQLLNVVSLKDETSDDEIQKAFKTFENKYLKNKPIPYKFSIIRGNLLEEIQRAIHFYKPSLLIMGTSGNALTKALVKLTDCAVMIIPENSSKEKIRNIVYANDFNEVKASSAFEPLQNLSQRFGAKVHIIHINKDEHTSPDGAEASLEYYLQLVDHEYSSVKSEDFVEALQDYVKREDIDVLSVLLRDHGQNAISSSGKLIEELVSKTEIPVLSLV